MYQKDILFEREINYRSFFVTRVGVLRNVLWLRVKNSRNDIQEISTKTHHKRRPKLTPLVSSETVEETIRGEAKRKKKKSSKNFEYP
jgi:hypothetical protein